MGMVDFKGDKPLLHVNDHMGVVVEVEHDLSLTVLGERVEVTRVGDSVEVALPEYRERNPDDPRSEPQVFSAGASEGKEFRFPDLSGFVLDLRSGHLDL